MKSCMIILAALAGAVHVAALPLKVSEHTTGTASRINNGITPNKISARTGACSSGDDEMPDDCFLRYDDRELDHDTPGGIFLKYDDRDLDHDTPGGIFLKYDDRDLDHDTPGGIFLKYDDRDLDHDTPGGIFLKYDDPNLGNESPPVDVASERYTRRRTDHNI